MPVNANNPLVLPATTEQTFSQARVSVLAIQWPDGSKPMQGAVEIRKTRLNPDSTYTDPPASAGNAVYRKRINDVFSFAASRAAAGKPELAQLIQGLAVELVKIAQEDGF